MFPHCIVEVITNSISENRDGAPIFKYASHSTKRTLDTLPDYCSWSKSGRAFQRSSGLSCWRELLDEAEGFHCVVFFLQSLDVVVDAGAGGFGDFEAFNDLVFAVHCAHREAEGEAFRNVVVRAI